MRERFEGKVAVVTGAAQGFGAATARRLAAEGARVVLVDVIPVDVATVLGDLHRPDEPNAICVRCDVAVEDSVRVLAERAAAAWGRLDVVVNNAGKVHRRAAMVDLDGATFDDIFAVNVKSVFLLAKHTAGLMADWGSIVNIASVAAERPRPGVSLYAASKAAMISLTRSLALELAPTVRVNAVAPAAADTQFGKAADGDSSGDAERFEVYRASVPLGRLVSADDVAAAVSYLASDDARIVTGITLTVDGGRSLSQP